MERRGEKRGKRQGYVKGRIEEGKMKKMRK